MDFYQGCSYDAPGVKTGPAPGGGGGGGGGVTRWNIGKKKPIFKFFFAEIGSPRALIFGIYHLLVDLYQVCSYVTPGVKIGQAQGVKLEHGNKEASLQNSFSLKLVGVWL